MKVKRIFNLKLNFIVGNVIGVVIKICLDIKVDLGFLYVGMCGWYILL